MTGVEPRIGEQPGDDRDLRDILAACLCPRRLDHIGDMTAGIRSDPISDGRRFQAAAEGQMQNEQTTPVFSSERNVS